MRMKGLYPHSTGEMNRSWQGRNSRSAWLAVDLLACVGKEKDVQFGFSHLETTLV